MPTALVSGIDLTYEIHGSGSPVVLISGTGADIRRDPNRASHPLTRAHQMLIYDQRGLGRSGKPDEPYTMADYADDCVGLLDAVGWGRAHVIGISFGGMVAQHVALRHPDRVDKLVLACTSSGGSGGASFDLLAEAALPEQEQFAAKMKRFDTRNDLSTDPPTWAPLMEIIAANMSAPSLNADDPKADIGARRQLEARAGHNVWDDLPDIAAETFVIGGRFDEQAPPENLENLASQIPDARMQLFDGGHLFFLQDRSAWASVLEFLAA